MCHLILMLPLLGLGVFWLWPLSVAVPVYVVILLVSLAFYYFIMRAMHQPVITGREAIIQGTGKVIEVREHKVLVRVRNEIWNAESPDKLRTGDQVEIVSVDGLMLRVQRIGRDRPGNISPAVSR